MTTKDLKPGIRFTHRGTLFEILDRCGTPGHKASCWWLINTADNTLGECTSTLRNLTIREWFNPYNPDACIDVKMNDGRYTTATVKKRAGQWAIIRHLTHTTRWQIHNTLADLGMSTTGFTLRNATQALAQLEAHTYETLDDLVADKEALRVIIETYQEDQ